MVNHEAISNSSTPVENEKIQRKIETTLNQDKIDLVVELTEEQKKQEEILSFGTNKLPLTIANKKSSGLGFGLNSFEK